MLQPMSKTQVTGDVLKRHQPMSVKPQNRESVRILKWMNEWIPKGYARDRKTCGLAQYFPCMASTISHAYYTIPFLTFPFVLKLLLFSAPAPCSSPQGRAAGELLHVGAQLWEGTPAPRSSKESKAASVCPRCKHLLMEQAPTTGLHPTKLTKLREP